MFLLSALALVIAANRAAGQPRRSADAERRAAVEPQPTITDVCPPPAEEAGEEDAEDPRCPPAPAPVEGSDTVADAPLPTEASGNEVPPERGGEYRWIGEAVLYIPKMAFELAFLLPRMAMYAYDRYDLKNRYYEIFFTDDRRTGVYPSLFFETGVGLNAGLRFVHFDPSGAAFTARAGFGESDRVRLSAKVRAPRFARGRGEYGIRVRYEDRPKRRFFGLGNRNLLPEETLTEPLDPLSGEQGFDSRYSFEELAGEAFLGFRVTDNVRVALSQRLAHRDFGEPSGTSKPSITEAYETESLPGFDSTSYNSYTEASLVLDFRRIAAGFMSRATPSSGPRLEGFVGYQKGFYDDPSDFVRWGLGFHYLIDVFRGDRALLLGIEVEGATGEIEDIPFVDLPTLGGSKQLRGYTTARFRDRYAAVATAEYRYPIFRKVAAFLFVDGGTVWRDFEDPSFDDFRVAFGGGLQAHTLGSFLARVQIGSSIDGGVEVAFTLDAPWGVAPRVAREKEDE